MSEDEARRTALAVVDMLNPYGHEDAEQCAECTLRTDARAGAS